MEFCYWRVSEADDGVRVNLNSIDEEKGLVSVEEPINPEKLIETEEPGSEEDSLVNKWI